MRTCSRGHWKYTGFSTCWMLMLTVMVHAQEVVSPPATTPAVTAETSPPEPVPDAQKSASTPPAPVRNVSSIFFSPEEQDALSEAHKQYIDRDMELAKAGDLVDQLQNTKETPAVAAAPAPAAPPETYYQQFYLQSLIYHTPNDWKVWVKENVKMSRYDTETVIGQEAELKLLTINKEDVLFEWRPRNWQRVVQTSQEGLKNVHLDEARQVVIFSLRVNQTFTSYDLNIEEGFVQPISIGTKISTRNPKSASEATP